MEIVTGQFEMYKMAFYRALKGACFAKRWEKWIDIASTEDDVIFL